MARKPASKMPIVRPRSAAARILIARAGTADAEVLVDTRKKIVRLKKGPGSYRRHERIFNYER